MSPALTHASRGNGLAPLKAWVCIWACGLEPLTARRIQPTPRRSPGDATTRGDFAGHQLSAAPAGLRTAVASWLLPPNSRSAEQPDALPAGLPLSRTRIPGVSGPWSPAGPRIVRKGPWYSRMMALDPSAISSARRIVEETVEGPRSGRRPDDALVRP